MTITTSAPRIDPRIRALIASAPLGATAAETTRAAGELAWLLGLPRPSYEQTRVLLGRSAPPAKGIPTVTRGRLHYILEKVDAFAEYPGLGLGGVRRQMLAGRS